MPTITSRQRFGKRLRKLRTDRGWSLNYVEAHYGIDKAVLSRVENGQTTPSLPTLRKLRDAYSIDDDTFLSWLDAA